MKILNCILHYNRGDHLQNATLSTNELFKYGKTIIVDDCSNDEETLDILSDLNKSGTDVFYPSKNLDYGATKHGHMYYNMDFCVQYAIDNNFEFIQFIQDDCQFVWHDSDFEARVKEIYSRFDNASMIENLFFNIAAKKYLASKLTVYKKPNCYNRANRGSTDLGLWKTKILKEARFSFGNGNERSNAFWWRKEGFRSYRISAPSMCQVPEPIIFRHNKKVLDFNSAGKEKFLMKPLSKEQIEKLQSNDVLDFPYSEDYCKPWGWECQTPYIVTLGNYERIKRDQKSKKYKYLINLLLLTIRGKFKAFVLFLLSHDTYIK